MGLRRIGVRCMPNRLHLSRTQVVVSGVLVSRNEPRGVSGNTPRVLPDRACYQVKVPPASLVPLAVVLTGLALLGLLCWSVWGKEGVAAWDDDVRGEKLLRFVYLR